MMDDRIRVAACGGRWRGIKPDECIKQVSEADKKRDGVGNYVVQGEARNAGADMLRI